MPRLSEYDYLLPEHLIAQEPLTQRSGSRLLHVHRHDLSIEDRWFEEIGEILREGDLLVLNNARVTARRLFGRRATGGNVEALLLHPESSHSYRALVKPARSLLKGAAVQFPEGLEAVVEEKLERGEVVLRFKDGIELSERIEKIGTMPLPPYIKKELQDSSRYQSVFADRAGSAAAPTAALHFTEDVLKQLQVKGVQIAFVTLDVGIDTFRPLLVDDLAEHEMHGEWCEISGDAAEKIETCKGRIVAVGTTAVRTLESMAVAPRRVKAGRTLTKLFIQPGFHFRVVDGMLTNFHMPKTTMLIMISAMLGKNAVLEAYHHAVEANYRFLSFGDSMLIL